VKIQAGSNSALYCTPKVLVNWSTASSPEDVSDSTVTSSQDWYLASLHRQLQSQDNLLRALNQSVTACITYAQESGAIKIQTVMAQNQSISENCCFFQIHDVKDKNYL